MTLRSLILLLAVAGAGCTHPIDIVGEGDVRSSSGDNDCLLEDLPCAAVAVTSYTETYTPNPRSGYEFIGWDNCLLLDGEDCVFDIPPDVVFANWLQTMPALVAKFALRCDDAPEDSFAAIQSEIFEGKNCSSSGCHSGASPAAGMSLTSSSAFRNIVNVTARSGDGLQRILPGSADDSYLYRKVAARTEPGSFSINGNPMPLIGSALSRDQLAALEAWINAGAPQFGRADEFREVEQLLGLCD